MPFFTNRGIIPLAGGGGGFTPASLPNLKGWWKADAGVYSDAGTTLAVNNDTVLQWNDQSGNGKHLTDLAIGGSVHQAFYKTSTLNSLPTLLMNTFDNVNLCTPGATIALGGDTCSAFGVFKLDTTAAVNCRIMSVATAGGDDTSTTGWVLACTDSPPTTIYVYNGSVLTTQAVTAGTWYTIGVVFNGTQCTIYRNGTAGTPASDGGAAFAANIGFGAMCVGATGGTSANSSSVAELLLTSDVITGPNLTSLQTYFSNKYGI